MMYHFCGGFLGGAAVFWCIFRIFHESNCDSEIVLLNLATVMSNPLLLPG